MNSYYRNAKKSQVTAVNLTLSRLFGIFVAIYFEKSKLMKKLLLTLLFVAGFFGLKAQLISTTGDTSFANGSSADFEIVAHANVRNTAASTATFRWVRVTNSLSANWKMAVCDVVTCYSDITDSAEFSLNPNETGNIDAHFYPNNNNGGGTTRVRIFEIGNPANQLVLTFLGSTLANSTADLKKPEFKLYPIPANDILFLKATKNMASGKVEIYNVIGKKIQEMNFNTTTQPLEIPVQMLPKGNYILRVISGRQVVSKSFVKQ